jgi:mRNA interferase MazF
MKEGEIALAAVPQADGGRKLRPIVLLRELPSYGDFLVCGISSQRSQYVDGFDLILSDSDGSFPDTGLLTTSIARLSFLAVLPQSSIPGTIGKLSSNQHAGLLRNLSQHLLEGLNQDS